MASFEDFDTLAEGWLNVSVAVGQNAGTNLTIQNLGQVNIRVEASLQEPTSLKHGVRIAAKSPAYSDLSPNEFVWVRSVGSKPSRINVQVS